LAAASKAEAPVVPYPDALPEMDAELLRDYLAEAREALDGAESALLTLERDRQDAEAVNVVFRAFHSIKGTSGFLQLTHIADLAHHAESVLNRVRSRELTFASWVPDLTLRAIDMMKALLSAVEAAAAGAPLRRPAGHVELFEALRRGERATANDGNVTPGGSAWDGGDGSDTPFSDHGTATSMRVRTDRLDRLVDMVGELVIAQWMIAQDPTVLSHDNQELAKKVAHAGKLVRELHDVSMSIRMVPLRATFRRMTRLLRDAARKAGKQVELEVSGADTEVDRTVVDLLGDPLVHLVRNAVDHGIESAERRESVGKGRRGLVRLSAQQMSGSVVVEVSDDGRGFDRARIIEQAVARGLISSGDGLSDEEVFSLAFLPGFSTAERLTELSGRGVGMDVVHRNVQALRGRVEIESRAGAGSTIRLRVPLTLAVTDGMLVRIGRERYIIPIHSILLSFRPRPEALSSIGGRGELVMLRDSVMPLVRLHRLLGVEGAAEDPAAALLVVVGAGDRQCALLVDELLGQQQVVAKALGDGIGAVAGIAASAILGDGRVGLILDIGEIIALARRGDMDAGSGASRAVA
jgi:two-component system chemotaxis sensor kinase CheA